MPDIGRCRGFPHQKLQMHSLGSTLERNFRFPASPPLNRKSPARQQTPATPDQTTTDNTDDTVPVVPYPTGLPPQPSPSSGSAATPPATSSTQSTHTTRRTTEAKVSLANIPRGLPTKCRSRAEEPRPSM